jgi:hypothetical protein
MDPVQTLALPSLAGDLARVEDSLHQAVSTPDRFLADVASHLIGAGGKRIRPTLTLCAAYAAAGDDGPAAADAVTGAVAIELVHQGSLYHDDVIDEAETRRGVERQRRWSNIVAILAGDFLLAGVGAGSLAGRGRRRDSGEHHRRAVPGPGAQNRHLFTSIAAGRPQLGDRGKTATVVRHVVRVRGMVAASAADARQLAVQVPPRHVLPDHRRRARYHRHGRLLGPPAGTSSRACTLPVIRGRVGRRCERLGHPLDAEQLAECGGLRAATAIDAARR